MQRKAESKTVARPRLKTERKRHRKAENTDLDLDLDRLISSTQVAKLLGVSECTVRHWRVERTGPPYIKLGPLPQSPIRYRLSDVERWIGAVSFVLTTR